MKLENDRLLLCLMLVIYVTGIVLVIMDLCAIVPTMTLIEVK